MYKLISEIAKRCHAAAVKRGKDTSGLGCMRYLAMELAEYWNAVDNTRNIQNFAETIQEANNLSDEDFNALYAEKIHNTADDELADILIVAATWLHAARLAEGEDFKPDRSIDVLLLGGAVQFVGGHITGQSDLYTLREVVNLKMREMEIERWI